MVPFRFNSQSASDMKIFANSLYPDQARGKYRASTGSRLFETLMVINNLKKIEKRFWQAVHCAQIKCSCRLLLFLRKIFQEYTIRESNSSDADETDIWSVLIRVQTVFTLNVPIATKIVCFSRMLKCLRSLYCKQCGPRSDCSNRSSLFWVHAVCFYP